MKIAFNPSTVAALIAPPNNKDITFDLRGHNIFARGVKFCGTDTNTWRDIKINNVSIGSHTLDLRNGSNTTLTNTNGVVTINSTWRPVVDSLTSNSATSSLSANLGRVLAGLINGKSDSDHNHDDRYLKLTGGTLTGNLIGTSAMFSGRFYGGGDDEGIIIKPSSNGYAGLILGTHDGERSIFYFVKNKPFWRYSHGSDYLDIIHPKKSGTIALTSDIPSSLKNPYALTISLNGTSQGPYDGSAAKNINITPSSIGAATSEHNHDNCYLKLTGGTMQLGEGLKFHADNNYFGTDLDARIISLLDGNDKICDGGLIIDERATLDGKEYVTELLRIRDSEFKWRGNNILHSGNTYVNNNKGYINGAEITLVNNADMLDGEDLITQVSDWNTDSLSIFKSSENLTSNAPTTDFIYGVTLRFHRDISYYHTDLVTSLYYDRLFFRRKTEREYQTWRELIHSGNISSQSVNYANSAGNADTVDGYHSSSFLTKHTREGAYNIDHLTDFVTRDLQPKSEINIEGTKPYDGWGIVTVLKTDNGTAQLVFDGGNNFYFRSSYGTANRYVTSAWKQVAALDSKVADSDKLDGIHANGLLTALSNSNNGISLTVGGTTKSVSNINVNGANTILGTSPQIAAATEYNSIYVSSPGYSFNEPVKMLCFDWYGNYWAFSNIRSGDDNSAGFGIFFKNTEIARFTSDGNLSCNVASATKLATARSIWGQSFDGTGNVSGSLSGVGHIQFSADNAYSIGTTTSEAAHTYTRQVWARHLNASRVYAGDTNLYIGYSNTAQVRFFSGTKQSGDGSNERMTISTNGNVGIGTAVPAYKLDVNGLVRASGFHHGSVNSDNYMLLAGGGYKSFGGNYDNPIFLGYLNLDHGDDGTISSSFYCLGYSVSFTYTRGGNYCKIYIPDTSYQTFYIRAATASVNYSGGGMDTWTGYHRGDGAWWLHCYASGYNEVRVKGFRQANDNNDSWWGGNPLWSSNSGANKITVCIFGYVIFK